MPWLFIFGQGSRRQARTKPSTPAVIISLAKWPRWTPRLMLEPSQPSQTRESWSSKITRWKEKRNHQLLTTTYHSKSQIKKKSHDLTISYLILLSPHRPYCLFWGLNWMAITLSGKARSHSTAAKMAGSTSVLLQSNTHSCWLPPVCWWNWLNIWAMWAISETQGSWKRHQQIWEALIVYHTYAQKWCMANLGSIVEREKMHVHKFGITFKKGLSLWRFHRLYTSCCMYKFWKQMSVP